LGDLLAIDREARAVAGVQVERLRE
jgi:hypothetical protein